MRRRLFPAFLLVAIAAVLPADTEQAASDEEARAVRIMDVDHLKQSVMVMDVAVLDVRGQEIFLDGHIPPAHPLDVDALARLVLTGPEPPGEAILRLLRRVPASPDRPLVLYDSWSLHRRDGFAAWLLAYAGFPGVHVLDGGFPAWFRRKNLGVYMGHPLPSGRIAIHAADLEPRPELRIDPADIENGPPDGAALLEVLPGLRPGDGPSPGPAQVRLDELLDDRGFFLFPLHLEELLDSRGIDPHARLLLKGPPNLAAFAWVAFTANGFDAALVQPLRPAVPAEPHP